MTTKQPQTGREQVLARLVNDPVYFAQHIFIEMGWHKHHPWTWMDSEIVLWMVKGPRESVTLAPRGYGKTHLVVAVVCYDLFRDTESKIKVLSKSERHAKDTVGLVKEVIRRVPFLRHLAPGPNDPDGALYFDVKPSKPSRSRSVEARGYGGQITGGRASRLIGDDLETRENVNTPESREALAKGTKEFRNIATYGDERITLIGTIHHETESLYPKLESRGYACCTWPMVAPTEKVRQLGLSPSIIDRMQRGQLKPGDIVNPDRHTPEDVAKAKLDGPDNFAMQFQLQVNLGQTNRYPLRLKDFIVMPVSKTKAPLSLVWGTRAGNNKSTLHAGIPMCGFFGDGLYAPVMFGPEFHPFQSSKMAVDPSGRGADLTGYACGGQLAGNIHIKALGGLPGGYSEQTLSELVLIARANYCTEIVVEDNFGQGAIADLIQHIARRHYLDAGEHPSYPEGWRCGVTSMRSTGQKELRLIDTLQPLADQHRLVLDEQAAADEEFQKQWTRLTRERNCLKHDDKIDAVELLVRSFGEVAATDPETAAKRLQEQKLEDDLRRVRDYHLGRKRDEPAWFQHQHAKKSGVGG